MTLYEKCVKLADSIQYEEPHTGEFLVPNGSNNTTIPATIEAQINTTYAYAEFFYKHVYYISDIHLLHHILNKFNESASDSDIIEYVKNIVHDLFSDSLYNDILDDYINPVILFGGDISSDFEIAKIFYSEFVSYWDYIKQQEEDRLLSEHSQLLQEYEVAQQRISKIEEELAENETRISKWKNSHSWAKRVSKPLTEYSRVPEHIKSAVRVVDQLQSEVSKYRSMLREANSAKEKCERINSKSKYIYAVLGNHELWNFENFDSCNHAYQELFDSLGILFLNNDVTWFGKPYKPAIIIAGGVGFAGYNPKHNADIGLYRQTLNREQEIEETKKWEETYNRAIVTAKERKSLLIVLTHNPIIDWSQDHESACRENIIYFNGHTHINYFSQDEDHNIHIFADNRIGYKTSNIRFKQAYLYSPINPFAGYGDGIHEINSEDYLKFYDYMGEHLHGNGTVERCVNEYGHHFYLIKHEGYYGFFLQSWSGVNICAGGTLKKIKTRKTVTEIDKDFSKMVNEYLRLLSPYRKVQEEIANAVKGFGGTGTIHGFIIDIDFYNHIMIDPIDGNITFYYSPIFGYVQEYPNLTKLLDQHNPILAGQYRAQLKAGEQCLAISNKVNIVPQMTKIDIKDSIYSDSRRMKQLQRLFEKNILRDWNEDLLAIPLDVDSNALPGTSI